MTNEESRHEKAPSRIEKELTKLIKSLPAGKKLPGVKKLAQKFGSSVATVDKILAKLEIKGLVERKPRSGTYVASGKDSLREVPFLIPFTIDEFTYRVLSGLFEENLNVKTIPLEHFSRYEKFLEESDYIVILPESINSPRAHLNKRIVDFLSEKGKKLIFVDRRTITTAISITFDNRKAGKKMATEIEKIAKKENSFPGRKVLYIEPPVRAYTTEQRLLGLKEKLESSGWHIDEFREDIKNLKRKVMESFDILIASDDTTAEKVLIKILKEGMRIPEDVKLASFGGFYLSKELPLRLTTLLLPVEELGRMAAKAVIEKLEPPAEILVEPGEIARGETL